MKTLITIISLAVAVLLSGCHVELEDHFVRGNKNFVEENRSIGTFNQIHMALSANIDVYITDNPSGNIILEGESNILPRIETNLSDGILTLTQDKLIRHSGKLHIILEATSINTLDLSGVGDVTFYGVNKAENIDLNISGLGNITMELESNNLQADITGAGDMNLQGLSNYQDLIISGNGEFNSYELESETTDASISGSGAMYLAVRQELDAKISGVGTIWYTGDPQFVTTKSNFAGKIRKVE